MNINEIENIVSAAPHGAKKQTVERIAEQFGVSSDTIYRQLRRKNGRRKKIEREKKFNNKLIHEIAKLKMYGIDGVQDRELTTELCIDILVMRGFEEARELTVSTANRRLRELGFRDVAPIKRIEAEYANQQHQIDFSRSKYFQLYKYDSAANDYLLKTTGKTLYYKEDDRKLRTWLVGITDAYSRASIAQAFPATNESSLLGVDFMNFAYTREDNAHPLKYLPETLKTDNGSFIKEQSVKQLLNFLQINSELSKPYKKRGIQKREAAWRLVWKWELKQMVILGVNKTIHLRDYNDLLHEFMIELLGRKHPIKQESRGHVYKASLAAHPPRVVEIDLKEAIAKPYERTINDDCTISINNQKYETTNYKLIGKRVRAFKNMNGEVVAELLDEYSKPFIMTPTEGFVKLGDYSHRAPATYRQKIENEVNEMKSTAVSFLPPRENKVDVETKFEAADNAEKNSDNFEFPNVFQAKVHIANQFGRNTNYEEYAHIFDPLLEDTLKRADIDEVINGLKEKRIAL